MRKEEFDPSGNHQQTPNNRMLPHWATPMQACYNPEFTPNPYYNHPPEAGSYLNHQYMWQNQENNALLQSNALHDPAKLSNKSLLAEDFPISKKQRSKINVGDGENKDLSFGCKKQKSETTVVGDEKPSGLIQSLRTVVKEYDADVDADAQLKYMEADDIRKERKRESNRESAKRTRLRKKQEREERTKIDTLNEEIAVLTKQLKSYSEACLELTDENDFIEEELIKEYGRESIADLLSMKPTA